MTAPMFQSDGSDRSAQDLRFWFYGGTSAGEKEFLRQCYIAGINAYAILQHVQAGTGGGLPAGGNAHDVLEKASSQDGDAGWSYIRGRPAETSANAGGRFVGAINYAGPPTPGGSPGAFQKNDFMIDSNQTFWICTVAGSPGTWKQNS